MLNLPSVNTFQTHVSGKACGPAAGARAMLVRGKYGTGSKPIGPRPRLVHFNSSQARTGSVARSFFSESQRQFEEFQLNSCFLAALLLWPRTSWAAKRAVGMGSLHGNWWLGFAVAALVYHQAAAIEFTRGVWLEQLAGYRELHRTTPRTFANISFIGEDIQVWREEACRQNSKLVNEFCV